MIASLLLALILGQPAAAPSSSDGEPWTITGENLQGTQAGTTLLTNPRAVQGGTTVTARRGTWYRDEDLLVLEEDVVLSDSSRTIHSDRGSYDRRKELAILTGNVNGEGTEGRFAARELRYFRLENRVELHDEVRLEEKTRILTSDRLDYETTTRNAIATGNVAIFDSSDSTTITGQRCALNRGTDDVFVTGGPPALDRPGRAGEAPLHLIADTLEMRRSTLGNARGNVRIRRGAVNATCGRAVYDFDNDYLRLLESPVAADSEGTVRGDSMAVIMRKKEAERLEVLGHARIDYAPDAKPGERNVVIGDTLIALMDSTGVTQIEVHGGAHSLYIPSPTDREGDVGQNLSRGKIIRVAFARGEARRVDLQGSASGDYVVPRRSSAKRDSTIAPLPDSLYAERAIARFLAVPGEPIPDSLMNAGPYDPAERVAYSGDSVAFFVPEKRIQIRGNGKVHYQQLDLESEEILYEASKDRVISLGKPRLKDQTSALIGQRMLYRLDTRQGFAYQGRTEFDGGYYNGEEIKRVNDKILLVRGADYTTCSGGDTTDYHFHAGRMKMTLGDKAVARPIALYIRNIPIMALPYWIFPIRKGRHSGMLMPDVEFGFDRTRGRFVRNLGYYLAPNDYTDEMVWGDYYDSPPRWILNGQFRYSKRYILNGNFFGSYSREKNVLGSRTTRWDVQGNHDQQLGERASLKVRANFVSDKTYRSDRDFGGSVDETLNRILKSSLDLRKSWSSTSIAVTADRTENLDVTTSGFRVQENIPSVDFSMNSFPIGRKADDRGRGGRLPFLSTMYSRFSASFRSVYRRPWADSLETIYNHAARAQTGLSDTRSLRFLTVSPSISTSGAWVYKDAIGKHNRFGAVWSLGISARSALYGTFPLGLGPLIGMRHVIEPSVSYSYSPDFPSLRGTDPSGSPINVFPSETGISLSGSKSSSMSMGLTQRFHLKVRGADPKKPVRIDNLILWQTTSSYNFLIHKRPLSAINNSIRLAPARFFENSWTMTHDPYRKRPLTSLSVQTTVRLSGKGGSKSDTTAAPSGVEEYGGFGQVGQSGGRPGERTLGAAGPWDLSLTHSYSRGAARSSETSTVSLSASVVPTSRWRVSYGIYYNLQDHQVVRHSLSLYRDLHCWEMRLEQNTYGGNSQYYFRINIKAIPDIQYERQRR